MPWVFMFYLNFNNVCKAMVNKDTAPYVKKRNEKQ